MASIELRFSSVCNPCLNYCRFDHPLINASFITVRGRDIHSGATGSFLWTKAVQALSIVFVSEALSYMRGTATEESTFLSLEGGAGSLASSLDYAMSKRTNWLMDMFGVDSKGSLILHRILRRQNSNLKTSGPVRILYNRSALPPKNILIRCEDTERATLQDLEMILASLQKYEVSSGKKRSLKKIESEENLESVKLTENLIQNREVLSALPERDRAVVFQNERGDYDGSVTPQFLDYLQKQACQGGLPEPFSLNFWSDEIHRQFKEEIYSMLHLTDIFESDALFKTISRMLQPVQLAKIASRKLKNIDRSGIDAKVKYDYSEKFLEAKKAFHMLPSEFCIAVTPAQPASIALLSYLRHCRGVDVEFDTRFANGGEMVEQMVGDRSTKVYDGFVMTSSAAAVALRNDKLNEYLPLMIMPKISQRIFGSRSVQLDSRVLNTGTYLVMVDPPSTLSVHLDQYIEQQIIREECIDREHLEASEIIKRLYRDDTDLRAIIGFPHYNFQCMFAGCKTLDNDQSYRYYPESILFVHQKYFYTSDLVDLLEIALKDAWLELMMNDGLLNFVTGLVLADREYVRFLSRCAGLFHFSFDKNVPSVNMPSVHMLGHH